MGSRSCIFFFRWSVMILIRLQEWAVWCQSSQITHVQRSVFTSQSPYVLALTEIAKTQFLWVHTTYICGENRKIILISQQCFENQTCVVRLWKAKALIKMNAIYVVTLLLYEWGTIFCFYDIMNPLYNGIWYNSVISSIWLPQYQRIINFFQGYFLCYSSKKNNI